MLWKSDGFLYLARLFFRRPQQEALLDRNTGKNDTHFGLT